MNYRDGINSDINSQNSTDGSHSDINTPHDCYENNFDDDSYNPQRQLALLCQRFKLSWTISSITTKHCWSCLMILWIYIHYHISTNQSINGDDDSVELKGKYSLAITNDVIQFRMYGNDIDVAWNSDQKKVKKNK